MPLATARQALVLFAHGARDARWAEPFERLRDITQQHAPTTRVELAFLELMSPSLPALAAQLADEGVCDIAVVPVFFGQGGHVRRDLPRLVQGLQTAYPHLSFRVADAVGEDEGVLAAMAAYCVRCLG